MINWVAISFSDRSWDSLEDELSALMSWCWTPLPPQAIAEFPTPHICVSITRECSFNINPSWWWWWFLKKDSQVLFICLHPSHWHLRSCFTWATSHFEQKKKKKKINETLYSVWRAYSITIRMRKKKKKKRANLEKSSLSLLWEVDLLHFLLVHEINAHNNSWESSLRLIYLTFHKIQQRGGSTRLHLYGSRTWLSKIEKWQEL